MKKGDVVDKLISLRKRKIFVFLLIVVLIVFLAMMILIGAGVFGYRAELCTIRVMRGEGEIQNYEGIAVNLDSLPSNNLIKDYSFEQNNQYNVFTVVDSFENNLFLSTEDFNMLADSYDNISDSSVRIYSIDENGQMYLHTQGDVVDFSRIQYGSYEEIHDACWYWTQDGIKDLMYIDSVVVAITDSGNLIGDVSAGELSKVYGDENTRFVALCKSNQFIAAVTDKGEIYRSADGRNFSAIYPAVSDDLPLITDMACVNGTYAVLLDTGEMIFYYEDGPVYSNLYFDNKATDMFNTDNTLYIVFENGEVISTVNCYAFGDEDDLEKVIFNRSVVASDANAGKAVMVLNDDRIVIFNEDSGVTLTSFGEYSINPEGNVYSEILENGIIIVSDGFGNEYFIADENDYPELLKSDCLSDRHVFAVRDNKLYIYTSNSLYSTSIYSGIKLEQPIDESEVLKGDICYLELNGTSVEDNNIWDVGSGSFAGIVSDAAQGYGQNALALQGSGYSVHAISQVIGNRGVDTFVDGSFVRIDLMLKAEGNVNNIKVWISSPDFQSVGFEPANVSDVYSLQSFTFAVTDFILKSEGEIRFNISFEGNGILYVDGVYVGLDKYNKVGIPDGFSELIENAKPDTIRFNCMDSSASDYIYFSQLENSFRLSKDSQSKPWLVLDSYTDADRINSLIEYMCGSVSSEYGSLRINNGTAVPWNRQFAGFIIEINDECDLFGSDLQRSAFVDYVIGVIQQSEYYVDIKDMLVILDGMQYEGGTVLSQADCHSSAFSMEIKNDVGFENNFSIINYVNELYANQNALAPRIVGRGNVSFEYVSSLNISSYEFNSTDVIPYEKDAEMTAAEYIVTLLSSESVYTRMIAVNIPVVTYGSFYDAGMKTDDIIEYYPAEVTEISNYYTLLNTISCLDAIGPSTREVIEVVPPLDEDSEYTLESFTSDVDVYLFENENSLYLIVANASDEQQQFMVSGFNISLDGATVRRYSATGELLLTKKINGANRRQTLQAGEFLIIEL